jgi:hypothetical protein
MAKDYRFLFAILPVLLVPGQAGAGEGEWTLQLEPMIMDGFGNDRHVLTSREIDVDAAPALATSTPVALDTENGPGYRFELRYGRESWDDWGLGLDFFWFSASQGRPARTAAASAPIDTVIFEVSDREYASSDPADVLYFNTLEDTDIATWTADLYATRMLLATPDHGLELQLGLRNADFDNDVHTVAGIQDVGGSTFDASSNYGRMIGPLVGLAADFHFGRNTIRTYLGQSLVFGTTDLSNMTRDFTGPFTDMPAVVSQSTFGTEQDTSIPITEFRVTWTYRINRRFALGLAANSSIWWDVPVPPGVDPGVSGNEAFAENTIRYFGLAGVIKLSL